MTYLDVNDFVSNEVLPLVNDIVEDYIESNFYYIENEEDLEDLEEAEVTEELFTDVFISIVLYNKIDKLK